MLCIFSRSKLNFIFIITSLYKKCRKLFIKVIWLLICETFNQLIVMNINMKCVLLFGGKSKWQHLWLSFTYFITLFWLEYRIIFYIFLLWIFLKRTLHFDFSKYSFSFLSGQKEIYQKSYLNA